MEPRRAGLELGGPEPAGGSGRPLVSFINPDAAEFLAPDNMPEAIVVLRGDRTDGPQRRGRLRCALDSIAMKFRHVLGMCEELAGGRIETIHIVGGGAQNRLLCQAAADASGRRVGPGQSRPRPSAT